MEEIADYKTIQPLSEKGTGVTYKAYAPPRLGISAEFISIKTKSRPLSESEFQQLTSHLAACTQTGSPNIANIYDVGRDDDLLYIVSEFFSHGSLAKPEEELSRLDVLEAMSSACHGAHALHEVGIAHCALQPANVLLSEITKIGDVGLLNVLSPGQTLAGSEDTATPIEYQSPERIQGQAPSRYSDIWALGATLHRALTGQSIFPNMPTDSLLSSVRHILNTQPVMSDSLRNGERTIIEDALSSEPESRHATAEAMADAITAEVEKQSEAGVE